MRTIDIVWNYERPYRVTIEGKKATIYRRISNGPMYVNENDILEPILETRFRKLFVDSSQSGTLLLHIQGREYLYVSKPIYRFTSDTILDFHAPLGENEVPYPWSTTTNGETILFDERVIVEELPNGRNMYHVYYDSLPYNDSWRNLWGLIPNRKPKPVKTRRLDNLRYVDVYSSD